MKKIAVIIVLIVFCVSIFIIYNEYQYKEKSIREAARLKNSDITKIVLIDGRDLSKSVIIVDKQKINEFMKLADNDIIRKEKKHLFSNGWQNNIDFYSNDKKIKTIVFTTDLEIDGVYYQIVKGDLTQKKIIELMYSTYFKK